jgi:EmrB/QacA subfamily drug resistance transporter
LSAPPRAATLSDVRDLGRPVLSAAAVVVCGAVMTILDSTIVNVAIERLGQEFGARLSVIQWVATAYLLAIAVVIPIAGWAVDRFGTRRVFLAAVAAFAAGSLLCGLAWSVGSLIAFRVLQGLGGGLVMPVGMTILARAAGPERMGRVMALVGVPMLLAPALGPLVGGALLDAGSWRLIFFINLPVAALALVLAARVLERTEPQPARFDVVGLALLSPGLAGLIAGLAAPVWLVVGLVLIAAFVVHALRAQHPLIDVRIFRDRVVGAATATTLLFGASFFGSLFLLALYYQLARDLSAFATGAALAAQGVGAMVTMPVAGKLTDRHGAGRVVPAGVALTLAGTIPFAFAGAPGWLLVLGLFLRGVGMGAALMPAMAAAYSALPEAAVARAASALEIVQRAGATLGIALLAVVLQGALTERGFTGSLDDLDSAPPADLAAAAAHTFTWAIALTAVTLIPALLLARPRVARDRATVEV